MTRRSTAFALAAAALAGAAAGAAGVILLADDGATGRGDLIAYGCDEPETGWFAICVVGTDGTGRRQLTHGLEASDPSWSPDGGRIVFTRHRSSGQRVASSTTSSSSSTPTGRAFGS